MTTAGKPAWWPRAERCAALLPKAIASVFPNDQKRVANRLRRDYPLTRESARVGLAIVFLSRGRLEAVDAAIRDAEIDWRDVLVAAENVPSGPGPFDLADNPEYFRWIASLDA